jgi:hypothetical protein
MLALFCWLALSAASTKSVTSDELFHITAGYSYWTTGQYRLQPENGNLPQRLAALPLLLDRPAFAPLDSAAWRSSQVEGVGREFFYDLGHDPHRLTMAGRSMITAVSAVIGAVVYLWSMRLFGLAGAWTSLGLMCLCPLMLSHGALATSDACAALFFTLSAAALWRLMHRLNSATMLGAIGAVAGLALSKFSAPLIVPVALAMAWVRLAFNPQPLPVGRRRVAGRRRQAAWLLGAGAVVSMGVWAAIWACYGFHHPAISAADLARGDSLLPGWSMMRESASPAMRLVMAANDWRLLPEAYLFGQAHTLFFSSRFAYAAGQFSPDGWWWYFPYALAVKTPIGIAAAWLAGGACVIRLKAQARYAMTPLAALAAIYLAAAMTGDLNIGLRHLLPIYPALFIIAGALASRLTRPVGRIAVALMVVVAAIESWSIRPDYLAFFNLLAGGPARGHLRLADSNIDWGQDLDLARDWIERRHRLRPEEPIYLGYFGPADLDHYRLPARQLICYPAQRRARAELPVVKLEPGAYLLSVNLWTGLYHQFHGPWNARWESNFRKSQPWIDRLNAAPTGSAEHRLLMEELGVENLGTIDALRQLRLIALLRRREPDERVGMSILVYQVGAEELDQALHGPPPPMRINPLIRF